MAARSMLDELSRRTGPLKVTVVTPICTLASNDFKGRQSMLTPSFESSHLFQIGFIRWAGAAKTSATK